MVDDDCSCRVIVVFTAHPLLLHVLLLLPPTTLIMTVLDLEK